MPHRKVIRTRSEKKICGEILFAAERRRVHRIAVIFPHVHANGLLGPKEMKKR